jgi:ligand-binding sensor domain-containing protein
MGERLSRAIGQAVGRLALLVAALAVVAPAAAAVGNWESFLHGGDSYAVAAAGDRVLVGTGAGLRSFSADGTAVSDTPLADLPGPIITAVGFAGQTVWVAATGGVLGSLDPDTNIWTYYDQSSKYPSVDTAQFLWDGEDVWTATRGSGVACYSKLRGVWQTWDRSAHLSSDFVNCLASDNQTLWAGTDNGLSRMDRRTQIWEPVETPANRLQGRITGLCESQHYLWIAAAGEGLSRIRLADLQLAAYNTLEERFKMHRVDSVLATADGSVWIAGDSGVIRAEKEGEGAWTFMARGPWEVSGLAAAGGCLWVATRHGGVQRYRPATDQWQVFAPPEALPGGDITAAAASPDQFWLGLRDEGLARYGAASGRWEVGAGPDTAGPGAEAPPLKVRDLAAADRFLYVAGVDGLGCYDQRENTWEVRRDPTGERWGGDEWSSVLATGDRLWCAGPGRVAVFDAKLGFKWRVPISDLEEVREGSQPRLYGDSFNGDVWIVTASQVMRYKKLTNQILTFRPEWLRPAQSAAMLREGRVVRDLAADNDAVWLVGLDKVVQYRKQDEGAVLWDEHSVPALARPLKVTAERTALWVAAEGGLCRFDRGTGTWSVLPWPKEFEGEVVTALASDLWEPIYLWVATARHAARLELGGDRPQWRVFPRQAAIVPAIRRIVPTRTGVWLVGRGGVTLYHRNPEGAPRS